MEVFAPRSLTEEELHLARDIEICIGEFQMADVRRDAMEPLMKTIFSKSFEQVAPLLKTACVAARITT